ncbi:MAG: hypothetical protein H7Y36_05340 [Armatimonadetes bacterium]|nr:hypothetical protein [Akkermansiaceae bacterium]
MVVAKAEVGIAKGEVGVARGEEADDIGRSLEEVAGELSEGRVAAAFGLAEWVVWGIHRDMPSRGRHQSTSKECREILKKIEAMEGVIGVIIGRSYGGKSLGSAQHTGSVKIQRKVSGGLKAVTQSSKGLQEIYIRTEAGVEDLIAEEILKIS